MNYRKAYEWGRARLEIANVSEASLDARLLLEFVCNTKRNDLYAHSERELSLEEEERFETLVKKRASRIPLQHLTNEQEFMGLKFFVNEDVLVPTLDTEILAEEALIAVNDGDKVLDLCTGSGCVLLSVMKYKNDITGVGTDISSKALEVAKRNYDYLKDVINGKAFFYEGDLFKALPENSHFDVIISNPPYIKTDVISGLSEEVKDHDPWIALDGGDDGLDFYRRIAENAAPILSPEGKILFEIGYDQADDVTAILMDNGFSEICVIKDLSGHDRVVRGKKYV